MASNQGKRRHNFRLSYAQDVGSSIDPNMEDVVGWEHDLQGTAPFLRHMTTDDSTFHTGAIPEAIPEDLDQEELEVYAAYAEEQASLFSHAQDTADCGTRCTVDWEQDLRGMAPFLRCMMTDGSSLSTEIPEDLDAELEEYIADAEAQALAAELEQYADQIFSISDDEVGGLEETSMDMT